MFRFSLFYLPHLPCPEDETETMFFEDENQTEQNRTTKRIQTDLNGFVSSQVKTSVIPERKQ